VRAEPLEPRRVRYPKGAYGWVDLRIVTEGHLQGLGPEAALVYLFLCTVGNRAGLSFWSRERISRMLHLTREEIDGALARLIAADLIAANDRIVQVLPVPDGCRRHLDDRTAPGAEDRPAAKKPPPPSPQAQRVPEPVEDEVSNDEIRAHEAQARAHIARFYGVREPSAGVVRALARSLARKTGGRGRR
jgi:hypothetical protein